MNIESLNTRFAAENPIFSVEFFPPKTDDVAEAMLKTASRIRRFNPDFVSITYGAGGGTRDRTLRYAQRLKEEFGFTVMPHLTCVGHSRDELKEIIDEFRSSGLRQIMALRGDPPKGQKDFKPHPDGLSYANELVDMIREIFPECALGVAGYPEKHPEAPSDDVDLALFRERPLLPLRAKLPARRHHDSRPTRAHVYHLPGSGEALLRHVRRDHPRSAGRAASGCRR